MSRPAPIQTLTIVGSGRVASVLAPALNQAGIRIVAIISRNPNSGAKLAEKLGAHFATPGEISPSECTADAILLAVPDDAILEAAKALSEKIPGAFLIHLSGSVSLEALASSADGGAVMWPIQTFAAARSLELKRIPFCISATQQHRAQAVAGLAALVSDKVQIVEEAARRKLHLAAVVVSNFPNHLYSLAHRLLEPQGLTLDLLAPLMEAASKLPPGVDPSKLQTGPAARGDERTVARQLNDLADFPELEILYGLFSKGIMEMSKQQQKDKASEA